jgi:hypothetical protein
VEPAVLPGADPHGRHDLLDHGGRVAVGLEVGVAAEHQ